MKLRNKKTGEVFGGYSVSVNWFGNNDHEYHSLAELNEEWEDEPSTVWYITHDGSIHSADIGNSWAREKNIGNYFETREEAEKAVEKLKAWKRLKDRGFRIEGWTIDDGLRITICTNTDSDGIYDDDKKEMKKDLDLLFEGEE